MSVNDPLCELRDLWFEQPRRGGQQMWALYVVPCEHGDVTKKIELTGKVPGTSILMLNRIRPIDEYVPMFAAIKGWRQDVENVNSIMKRGTPLHGQATSLSAAHFELDVLGSALWVNSTCWDIHVGAVSNSAKRRKRRNRKAALKAPSNL